MHASQIAVRFEEVGNFYKNQLSLYKKYWILYINFENFGIHTFRV